MSNLLHYKKPIASQSRNDSASREAVAALCGISPRLSEIRNAQTQLKEDIRLTVLMLDLVVAHARQVSRKTDDVRVKQDFDNYLASVDDLLDLARQKAIAL